MTESLKKRLTLGLFILGTLAPILIMLLAPQPASRQWWRDGAVALGFIGFALMGWQFVPMARIAFLTDIFGQRALLKFHIDVSLVALYLLIAHPVALVLGNPRNMIAFNLFSGTGRLRSGVIAFLLLVVIAATCVWRAKLKLKRDPWLWLHDILAVAIMGFSLHHVLGVGYYTAVPLQRWLWIFYIILWSGLLVYTRASAMMEK